MPEDVVPGVGPVPTHFSVDVGDMPDGSKLVTLIIRTPVGVAAYFLPPETAVQLSEILTSVAKQAASGLTLPASNGKLHLA